MKVLVNFVFYHHVGHLIEAIVLCKGIYNTNKNCEIHLIVNGNTPIKLTRGCPWIKATYPIDLEDVYRKGAKSQSYKEIPRNFDYIINNNLILEKGFEKRKISEKGMVKHFQISKTLFKAKKGIGKLFPRKTFPKGLNLDDNKKVLLKMPKATKFIKEIKFKQKNICVLLGGSKNPAFYPALKCWERIFVEIFKEFPDAKIFITGVTSVKKGQTATPAYDISSVKKLEKVFRNIEVFYDIGLWNQIHLIKKCDVLLSPHSGFSFIAPLVNTPWIEIAGGNWPSYLFNEVPFYSVLPDNPKYPYKGRLTVSRTKNIIPSMRFGNLTKKIPEIIHALDLVFSRKLTYKKSINLHKKNILRTNTKLKQIPSHPY